MARAGRRFRFEGRLLHPIEKRDLINAKDANPEVVKAYGQLYWDAGRFSDALDFFLAAGDADGLVRVKARAIEAGDSFLLHRLEATALRLGSGPPNAVGGRPEGTRRAGALSVERADWLRLAEQAEKLGKASVAEIARQRSEPAPATEEKPTQRRRGTENSPTEKSLE